MRERKTVCLVEAKARADGGGPGTIEGYASVFGGIDSYGDQIQPGAYAETLAEFLADGFVAWGHDWNNPIATPTVAREDERGLWIAAEFHTDAEAQRARTIATERLERGKSMGLSIGYEALAWEWRKVDEPVRDAWGDWTDRIRVLTRIKLYEVSLVTVPADEAARVTAAKGTERLADQVGRVLTDLEALTARFNDLAALRAGDGRTLSDARRADVAAALARLDALVAVKARLEPLLASPACPDGRALYAEFLKISARQQGVAV
jgi:HK97 family phage prohead protease